MCVCVCVELCVCVWSCVCVGFEGKTGIVEGDRHVGVCVCREMGLCVSSCVWKDWGVSVYGETEV